MDFEAFRFSTCGNYFSICGFSCIHQFTFVVAGHKIILSFKFSISFVIIFVNVIVSVVIAILLSVSFSYIERTYRSASIDFTKSGFFLNKLHSESVVFL